MSAPANAERAASADAALLAYMSRTHSDCEDSLAHLLCDLMHWADQCGMSFDKQYRRACTQYAFENKGGKF